MSVAAAGYLIIEAQDPAAWMDFGTGILGLMDANRDDAQGAKYLRMDDHPFRFMIEPGNADRLIAAGLEYRTEADWQAACDALTAAGHSVVTGSDEDAERRCVTRFVTVIDPSGNILELYYGRKLDYVPLYRRWA